MGQEVICTARWGGKSVRGKALLETSEIIFRGEGPLKIPYSTIRGMETRDGELRIKTGNGLVVFQLGEQAEKWQQKIANPKSVVEKLGVKPGEPVAVFGNMDSEFLKKLKAQNSPLIVEKIADGARWIFLACESQVGLRALKKIAQTLKGNAALWVVYPKGQMKITEADVISAGRKVGLKDVKVVGFSASRTALKFVIPVEKR